MSLGVSMRAKRMCSDLKQEKKDQRKQELVELFNFVYSTHFYKKRIV